MSSIGSSGNCLDCCPNQLGEEIGNGNGIKSPLIIESQSGLQYATLSEDNAGNFAITTTTNAGDANGGDITLNANGVIIAPQAGTGSTDPTGALSIKNSSTSSLPATWTLWNAGAVGGGLTTGHLQLYSYAPNPVSVFDIDPATGNTTFNTSTTQRITIPQLAITTPPPGIINPPNSTSTEGNNLRPLMWDSTTNTVVIPQTPPIRYFRVNTPNATGNPVDIIDPQGNGYTSDDWVCAVAGFGNASGDRTYNAYCIPYAGANWKVLYDTAGNNNQVWILAISTAFLASIQY